MNQTPTPDSFQQPTTDAAAKAGHRQEQAPRGGIGAYINGANGQQVSTTPAYSDPQGTVFIDRESHAGAWAKFLRDTNHGE
jgi:hypothetical protein